MSEVKNESARNNRRIQKIVVDRDLCIGAASCVALAGKVFQLDEHQKAIVVDPTAATDADLLAAAQSCPVLAIALHDRAGQRLFPEDEAVQGG